MRFEWDPAKNRTNQAKHGLAFEIAAKVFDDPNAVLTRDRAVEGEQRWHALGAVSKAVLLVVHVYREDGVNNGEEIIRIISARAASQRERRVYIQQAGE